VGSYLLEGSASLPDLQSILLRSCGYSLLIVGSDESCHSFHLLVWGRKKMVPRYLFAKVTDHRTVYRVRICRICIPLKEPRNRFPIQQSCVTHRPAGLYRLAGSVPGLLVRLIIWAQHTDDCSNLIYERPDNQRQYFGRIIQGSAGESRTFLRIIWPFLPLCKGNQILTVVLPTISMQI
jgi:hypothetical protein